MTIEKSANGQNNNRGECMLSWDGSQKVVAMADGEKIGLKWFILPFWHETALDMWTKCCKEGNNLFEFTWLLSGDKGEGKIYRGCRRGLLSAMHWLCKKTSYSKRKGMFFIKEDILWIVIMLELTATEATIKLKTSKITLSCHVVWGLKQVWKVPGLKICQSEGRTDFQGKHLAFTVTQK